MFGFYAGEMQVDRDYEGKHISHNRINQILIELGLSRTSRKNSSVRAGSCGMSGRHRLKAVRVQFGCMILSSKTVLITLTTDAASGYN